MLPQSLWHISLYLHTHKCSQVASVQAPRPWELVLDQKSFLWEQMDGAAASVNKGVTGGGLVSCQVSLL